jgi:hypothetical protein
MCEMANDFFIHIGEKYIYILCTWEFARRFFGLM